MTVHPALKLAGASFMLWQCWHFGNDLPSQMMLYALTPLALMGLIRIPPGSPLPWLAMVGIIGVAAAASVEAFTAARVLFGIPLLSLTILVWQRVTDLLWLGFAMATTTELVAWSAGNIRRGTFGQELQMSAIESGFGPLAQHAQWLLIIAVLLLFTGLHFTFGRTDDR